jgi:hypothetical protein
LSVRQRTLHSTVVSCRVRSTWRGLNKHTPKGAVQKCSAFGEKSVTVAVGGESFAQGTRPTELNRDCPVTGDPPPPSQRMAALSFTPTGRWVSDERLRTILDLGDCLSSR